MANFNSGYILFLFLYMAEQFCYAANVMFAMTGPNSHYECGIRVATILRSRGHNVTFLLPKFESESPAVTRHVGVFNFEFTNEEKTNGLEVGINIFERFASGNIWEKIVLTNEILDMVSGWWRYEIMKFITDPDLMDRIESAQYDVTVVEGNFVWLIPLIQKHHDKFVTMTTHAIHSVNAEWFNLPTELSYIPFDNSANKFEYDFRRTERLSFFKRTLNLVQLFQKFHIHTLLGREMAKAQLEYNIAPGRWGHDSFGQSEVWLTNADFATDYPRPIAPNMAMVGGLTVQKSSQLSEEFLEIYEAAGESGVLVVSMGTVIQTRSQDIVDSMAAAFARLPQKVIWKSTDPLPTVIGNNTILKKWIPQNDLLGHPGTRGMVYHCGNNGAFEALYHGVPIIAIPIFADQTDVAYRIMSNGMGLVVEMPSLTNERLYGAISEVLNNPTFSHRAKELSAIYRDSLVPAPDRAAFWIEYVLRHGGSRFLKLKAADMGFVQEYLIDVWIFLLSLSVSFLLVARRVCVFVLRSNIHTRYFNQ